jgi:hypothetical protein
MQNKVLSLLAAMTVLLTGCMSLGTPFEGDVHVITIRAVYPQGFDVHAGASVSIKGISNSSVYALTTGEDGLVSTNVPNGIYSISVQERSGNHLFNGRLDKVVVSGENLTVDVDLFHSVAGKLVIKELYCGGCPKLPEEGTYQSDQYLIVHNNDQYTTYLDGLCLGTLSPYNSTTANPWTDAQGNLPDFAPVIQAIWRVGGTGNSFPLEPGADAVICLRGAINHAAQYPLSVNLNKPGYFVCYNPVYFPNPTYHPAPGDQITEDHYLEVVIKTGQANAYTLSINSPTVILFRPEEGTDIHDYVALPEHLIQVPGSSIDRVVSIPLDWIIDGMEVFNGGSSNNRKRLHSLIDSGAVSLSETFKGHSLMRNIDPEATRQMGFEVLSDTNNSTLDFYEREVQSLHE